MNRRGQERRQPLVIELVGLPGAGKTTLERGLILPHENRTSIPLWRTPFGPSALKILWQALILAVTSRPFRMSQLRRSFALFFMLRCYVTLPTGLVVLDQGLVQKIWSLLLETRSYPEHRLRSLIADCSAFGPSAILVLDATPELAASRIARREDGNSRFEIGKGRTPDLTLLAHGEELYRQLLTSWGKERKIAVLSLAADLPLSDLQKALGDLVRQTDETGK